MAKKLYLFVDWKESKEKNHSRVGDSGRFDTSVTEGERMRLIGIEVYVKRLTDDEITLAVEGKGEYVFGLGESAIVSFSDGYQVAGDWVDESITYTLTLSDVRLKEHEDALPALEIEDGVLKTVRRYDGRTVIPEGVTELGHACFSETRVEEIVLPSTLKKIGGFAFHRCKYLTRITLPEGVEEIGAFAFADSALEDIDIPKSVKTIDSYAFSRTPFIERQKDQKFVILGDGLLYLYHGYDRVLVIPDGVKTVCPAALSQRKGDEYGLLHDPIRIVLPDSVKRLCQSAFYGLYGLKEINLRRDMEIHEQAFYRSEYGHRYEALLAAWQKEDEETE